MKFYTIFINTRGKNEGTDRTNEKFAKEKNHSLSDVVKFHLIIVEGIIRWKFFFK